MRGERRVPQRNGLRSDVKYFIFKHQSCVFCFRCILTPCEHLKIPSTHGLHCIYTHTTLYFNGFHTQKSNHLVKSRIKIKDARLLDCWP